MKMLYHYTSLAGILGIIGNKSIWATDVSYLNDASEFFHALNIAKQEASKIIMDDDYLAAFGWAMHHGLETVTADDIYITSFSEKADLLSQWRGYCPAGAGMCLGFEFDHLMDFCDGKGYRLEQCIYKHSEKIQRVNEMMTKYFENFPKHFLARRDYQNLDSNAQVNADIEYMLRTSEGQDKLQADAAVRFLCNEIYKLAPLFKNEGFHEESEWRIVANEQKEAVKFRPVSSYLAPFLELKVLGVTASPLREVIIGPNPNQHRCKSSIRMLLDKNGVGDVNITTSPLPFNSW
jgi:hypothetical protein